MMTGPSEARAGAGKLTGIIAGEEIEFFFAPKEAQAAGSLISTYRVVNTTLRAESEN
jgi:hypothetical protein